MKLLCSKRKILLFTMSFNTILFIQHMLIGLYSSEENLSAEGSHEFLAERANAKFSNNSNGQSSGIRFKTHNKTDINSIILAKRHVTSHLWFDLQKYGNTGNVSQMENVISANHSKASDTDTLTSMERNYYKRKKEIVNKFFYTYTMQPNKVCNKGVFVIVLVHSKPSYHEMRDAIRRTWGSVSTKSPALWPPNLNLNVNIDVVFVTGLDRDTRWNTFLLMENELHGDILQGDFIDDYQNMTLKSLLGLKYVAEKCQSVPYMLKSDDDMFINIPYLVKTLQEKKLERSIMGPYNDKSKVLRRGKWKLTEEQFPFDYFPHYESGSAYVITVDIVKDLYETSSFVPWIFIDDVYVTGILAKIIGASHEYKPKLFSYWTDHAPKKCDVLTNKKITFTKSSPELLYDLWGYLKLRNIYTDECEKNRGF